MVPVRVAHEHRAHRAGTGVDDKAPIRMTVYSRLDLAHLSAPIDTVTNQLIGAAVVLPSMTQVRSLASWDDALLGKFDRTTTDLAAQGVDRSGAMAELSYLMAEHGWSNEQMYVGLQDVDDRWGKFVGRHNRQNLLIDLVNRARQRVGDRMPSIDAAAMVRRLEGGGDVPRQQTSYTWGEFIKADFPVHWQLEDLMPTNGIGLIVAPPGTGKTQLAIGIGAAVSIGRDRFLQWPIVGGPQSVLFLSLEMNAPGLHLFMSTMHQGYVGEHAALNTNFTVEPLGTPMPLDQKAGQDWFDAQLDEHRPQMVIIDSMQRIVSKEMTDEIAVKEMMHYLSSVRAKYNTSMLIVHHHRKKSTEAGKKHALELDDVYGSRYITADVDFVLGMNKLEGDDVLEIRTLKNRYARTANDLRVTRDGYLRFSTEAESALGMQRMSGL